MTSGTWTRVCRLSDLTPERGAAVLVEGRQVAIFRLEDDRVYAVSNLDPFSGANVMARGLVGTLAGHDSVASPMYKQVFALETGECLSEEGPGLEVWSVRLDGQHVDVGAPG